MHYGFTVLVGFLVVVLDRLLFSAIPTTGAITTAQRAHFPPQTCCWQHQSASEVALADEGISNLKGLVEKVHTFDTRGYTVPLLRRYDRSRARRDRDIVW